MVIGQNRQTKAEKERLSYDENIKRINCFETGDLAYATKT